MSKVVFGMAMSLDGFINDRVGSVSPLYPDFAGMHQTDHLRNAIKTTGAVVMGRHTYDMANGDFTGYEFQVPIFVVTHQAPDVSAKGENDQLTFRFVTDGVESALAQAKAAAGDRVVTIVGGAQIAQQCLEARLLDEIEISLIPVLLGGGVRLFGQLDTAPIHLERLSPVEDFAGGTLLRFRVLK